MKSFQPLKWQPAQCRKDLLALRKLLAGAATLKERDDLLPFFRTRPHLIAFLGSYHPDIVTFDRFAHEYDLFGDFTCDLAAGDSQRNAWVFIELEDAAPNSVFVKRKGKSCPDWAARFDHGFSQIIDWFCKLHEVEKSEEFEDRFGVRTAEFVGLLAVGRAEALAPREQRRLKWRQERVVVNSNKVRCVTFDQLCDTLLARLEKYSLTGG